MSTPPSKNASRRQPASILAIEQGQRHLFEKWPDGVLLVDTEGIIRHANPAAVGLFGYSQDEFQGLAVEKLLPAGFRGQHRQLRSKFQASPSSRSMAPGVGFECLRNGGSKFKAEIMLEPVSASGETWVWAIVRDVSERDLESDERSQERQYLTAIGQLARSAVDFQSREREFGSLVRRLVPNDSIVIATVMADRRNMYFAYADYERYTPSQEWAPATVHVIKGTAPEGVLATGAAVLRNFENAEQFLGAYPAAQPISGSFRPLSVLVMPLQSNDDVFGFLIFRSAEKDAYASDHLRLARHIAVQIAGQVAQTELRRRQTELSRERALLRSIGQLAASTLQHDQVFDELADLISQLVSFDALALVSIDHDAGMVVVDHVVLKDAGRDYVRIPGSRFPVRGSMAEEMIKTGGPLLVLVESTEAFNARYPRAESGDSAYKYLSTIAIPMMQTGSVTAALIFQSLDPNVYSEEDLRIATQIGTEISGPAASAVVHRRELDLARERGLLRSIGRLAASTLQHDQVFEELADLFSELVSFDALSLATIDHDAGMVTVDQVALRGVAADYFRKLGSRYPLQGSITEAMFNTGEPLLVLLKDVEAIEATYPGAASADAAYKYLSTIAIPMMQTGLIAGALVFQSFEPDVYSDEDLRITTQIGTEISGPVASAVLHRRELELAREREMRLKTEDERRRIQAVSDAKSQFIGMLTHELKTPLTNITAFSDILSRNRSGDLSGRELKHVNAIQRNGRLLEGLINDLLDLSRIESGKFDLDLGELDIEALLGECVENIQLTLQQKAQRVTRSARSGNVKITADGNRLRQAIMNLLGNASKYSPDATEIKLQTTVSDSHFEICIIDQGVGLSESCGEELFEPFTRGDNEATRKQPGTGIGLHVARRVIEAHHGSVTLKQNDDGPGATACIRLPLRQDESSAA